MKTIVLKHKGQIIETAKNGTFQEFNRLQDKAWELAESDKEAKELADIIKRLKAELKEKQTQLSRIYRVEIVDI